VTRRLHPVQRPSGTNGPVTVVRPDPEAWTAALRLAGGEARRLRVVSTTEVIVKNPVQDGRRA
jgi:hypothetical protein